MATCNDCIHSDICLKQYSGLNQEMMFNECKKFKNKADVVPVVRCKDCKHRGRIDDIDYVCGRVEPIFVSKDHFCSYGERKCENKNTSTENSFLYNRFMKIE